MQAMSGMRARQHGSTAPAAPIASASAEQPRWLPALLDTTVLIDFLRGRPRTAARLARLHGAGERLYVCAISVEELWRGLRADEEAAAESLIAGLRTAPLGKAEGRTAGRWRREYAARGHTLAQADCLIAAAARSLGATLATGNPRDFPMARSPRAEIALVHWAAGE